FRGLFFYILSLLLLIFFFFQAEDGIRDRNVTGVQTCALPICGETPCSINHLPAGVSLPIAPAGEMWSVVTESPNFASTFKSFKGFTESTSAGKSLKNVGF